VAFPLRKRRSFMSRSIQGWSTPSCFVEASLPFPWGVFFHECRLDRGKLWSIQTYNQRCNRARVWATAILSKMALAFALRVSKSGSGGNGFWPFDSPARTSAVFFFLNSNRRRVLVSVFVSIRSYVRCKSR
jgi:hypothetical protein